MKRLFLFSAAVAVLLSCAKESPVDENPNPDTPVVEYQTITFEAVVPTTSDCPAPAADGTETKTTLVNHSLVHWVKGDAVKVMFVPINGYDNRYIWPGKEYDGANGVMTATFDSETSASALFQTDSWDWGVGSEYMGVGIAVHPSSVETYSHRNDDYYDSNALTVIAYNLPSDQTAVENSFQNGILFSYAEIANVEEFAASQSKLNFKNACALIKVTLPADATDIVSLTVESSDVTLSGRHKVNSYSGTSHYAQYYPTYPLAMTSDGGVKNVTLSAPTGETLKAGASYYIVTWPGTHSKGLTFTFTNKDGRTVEKSISSEVVLEKSKIDKFTFSSITFPHVLEASPETLTVQAQGTYTFDLTSTRDWTATSDANWVFVITSSGTGSMTPAKVTLMVQGQTENKTATITIQAGNDEIHVTVNYEPFVPELSIERYGSWSKLAAEGGATNFQHITVKSNVAWTLSTDSDWLTLGTTSGNATTGETVMLTPAENTTTSERTATLYLRDEDNTVEQTFTVTQEAGKKTSGYKVVGAVLPEDLQTGKYYVIANYGDPTRYWTVGDASNYDLTLTSGFNSDAYSNEFSIDHIFYVTEIYKNTGMSDTGYSQRVQIALFSYKSEKGMYYVSSTATYRFTNSYGIYLNLGARYTGEYGNDVDMRDNSRGYYISTPDASKITCSDSGFTGTGPRKWLIYEVQ